MFKFNEPKQIGKIFIYDRYKNNDSAGTGNHNIYLVNEDNVSTSVMPVPWADSAYVTPTIPYISGSNYKSIMHATSGVSWGTTAPESNGSNYRFDKTYDFTTTPFAFIMQTHGSIQNPLESITITGSSNLETIGEGCLQNTKISSITLPSSLTTIDNFAFKNTKINSVTIPSSLTTIGKSAFEETEINTITLPDTVTQIKDYAFANCPNLATAVIHRYTNDNTNNPITAGNSIFNNMRSLDMTIHSNSNWTDIAPGYRYVFYERDLKTKAEVACISEFEVWDNNGIRISHITGNDAPEILWSTKVYDDDNYGDSDTSSNLDPILGTQNTVDEFGWPISEDVAPIDISVEATQLPLDEEWSKRISNSSPLERSDIMHEAFSSLPKWGEIGGERRRRIIEEQATRMLWPGSTEKWVRLAEGGLPWGSPRIIGHRGAGSTHGV